jgi:predicted DCC family thiol-disulfide oxidoreductase YuxK
MNNATQPAIILFDGVCNLCRGSVKFVIKRDSKERFQFGSLQSIAGKRLLQEHGLHDYGLLETDLREAGLQDYGSTSVILLQRQKAYTKSSAALTIAKQLDWPWPLLYGFILVPKFLRDAVYDFIGKRRYRWFGKQDRCWIPPQPVQHRFIDNEDLDHKPVNGLD